MASTSTSCSSNYKVMKHESLESCFSSWMIEQRNDLLELGDAVSTLADDKMLKQLVQKNIKQFEQYHDSRALLFQHNAPSFFSPPWATSLENSFLWIGGCRPSLFTRLLHSVSGTSKVEDELQISLVTGEGRVGKLGDVSPSQLSFINSLHAKAVCEEDELSTKMANLQESIADVPVLMSKQDDDEIVFEALDAHVLPLASILQEADKLRLNILKELLIEILTPSQAVHFLVAYKKLHLSMHEWGKKRDDQLNLVGD